MASKVTKETAAPKKQVEKSTKKPRSYDGINRFLRYLSIVLVIVFTSFAIVTLITRSRLLTPQVYNDALAQSGIYELATEVVEDKVTDVLLVLEREAVFALGLNENPQDRTFIETAIVFVLTNTLDDLTRNFVTSLSDRIDLAGIIQSAAEEMIESDLAWLSGQRPDSQIFAMIPEPSAIENYRQEGFDQLMNQPRSATIDFERLTNLPICDSLEQTTANLTIARGGDFASLSCTSDEITLLLTTSLSSVASNELIFGEGGFGSQIEELNLTPVIDAVYEVSLALANFKQDALMLRDLVARSRETAIFFFTISIPLLIYALIVSKGRRVATLLRVYLASGLVISVFAMLQYLSLSNVAANFTGSTTLYTEGFLNTNQQLQLAQSIRSIELHIIRDVSYYILLSGVVLIAITATPLVVIKFLHRRGALS